RDGVVGVVELRKNFGKCEGRIVRCATPEATVQIVLWPLNLDLDIRHATQTMSDSRLFDSTHRRIADHAYIGFEQVKVSLNEGLQIGRRNLFFALNQQFHIDRRTAIGLQIRLESFDVNEQLPFIVCRTAREDFSVLLDRLKWGRVPSVFNYGGYHVVVAIHQHRRLVWPGTRPLAVDDRMTTCGHYFRGADT